MLTSIRRNTYPLFILLQFFIDRNLKLQCIKLKLELNWMSIASPLRHTDQTNFFYDLTQLRKFHGHILHNHKTEMRTKKKTCYIFTCLCFISNCNWLFSVWYPVFGIHLGRSLWWIQFELIRKMHGPCKLDIYFNAFISRLLRKLDAFINKVFLPQSETKRNET